MRHTIARASLAAFALLASTHAARQERAPGVQRPTFIVEVDCDRARAIGWGTADDPDARVVELAAGLLRRRFAAMERAARVTLEPEERRIEIGLPSIDPRDRELIGDMVRSIGLCEFLFVADEESVRGLDVDLALEARKLEAWRETHAALPLAAFNALEAGEDGPQRRIWWAAHVPSPEEQLPPQPLLLPADPAELIGAACFENHAIESGRYGFPAIHFDIRSSRQDDLARLTAAHQNERIGFVVGDDLVSAPTLLAELRKSAMVEGRFDDEVAARWLDALKRLDGPLRLIEVR